MRITTCVARRTRSRSTRLRVCTGPCICEQLIIRGFWGGLQGTARAPPKAMHLEKPRQKCSLALGPWGVLPL